MAGHLCRLLACQVAQADRFLALSPQSLPRSPFIAFQPSRTSHSSSGGVSLLIPSWRLSSGELDVKLFVQTPSRAAIALPRKLHAVAGPPLLSAHIPGEADVRGEPDICLLQPAQLLHPQTTHIIFGLSRSTQASRRHTPPAAVDNVPRIAVPEATELPILALSRCRRSQLLTLYEDTCMR
ncbi:hypothetical protein VUR80DRAFT_4774 [Thermomyces stellatus]